MILILSFLIFKENKVRQFALIISICIRKHLTPTSCVLCGKEKLLSDISEMLKDLCDCPSSVDCRHCLNDVKLRSETRSSHGVHYSCPTHGQYRHYEDVLMEYKVSLFNARFVPVMMYAYKLNLFRI